MQFLTDKDMSNCVEKMAVHLATLRSMLGVSQEELGALLGVVRSTVVYIENKQRKMTWTTYLSLLFIFTQHEETLRLMEILDILPQSIKDLYCINK